MKVNLILFFSLYISFVFFAKAQVSITDNSVIEVDLSTVMTAVVNGPYDASGADSNPATGELDTDAWQVQGSGDEFLFGDNPCCFGNGSASSFRNNEGYFTYNDLPLGNFGWQLGRNRNNSIELKAINNTGNSIIGLEFSYVLWTVNDSDNNSEHLINGQAGSHFLDFSGSSVISTPTTVDDIPSWEFTQQSFFFDLSSDPLLPGEEIIINWSSYSFMGSDCGQCGDDAALTDITIQGLSTLGALGEPAAHATGFNVNSIDGVDVEFNWTASDAERYLIVATSSGIFPSINDFTYYSNDTDFSSDDYGYLNISNSSGSPFSFKGLDPNTSYDFRIYAYNNIGANSNYKIDGIIPEVSATTLIGPGTTLINGTGLTTISSIDNSSNIQAFNFFIQEEPDPNNQDTFIDDIIIKAGTGNEVGDWTELIKSANLINITEGDSRSAVIFTDYLSVNLNTNMGRIRNGDLVQFVLEIELYNGVGESFGGTLPVDIDGKHLVFSIGENDIVINTSACGSCDGLMAAGTNTNSGVDNNEITVEATQLVFTTPPPSSTSVGVNVTPQIVVEAQDVNGNRDLDINTLDNLTNSNNLSWVNVPTAFLSGVLTFPTNFQFISSGSTSINIGVSGLSILSNNITVCCDASISGVSSIKPAGNYTEGEVITIDVVYNRNVTLSGGTPTISLNTGSTATYSSGSGTNTLTFTYTVLTCEETADLGYTSTTALVPNGSSLVDNYGNTVIITLPTPGLAGSLSGNEAIVIIKKNHIPLIDAIPDPAAILEDAIEQVIDLTGISDNDCDVQTVTISTISSNTDLIPDPIVIFTSGQATGSMTYTPVKDVFGNATITVIISDDGDVLLGGIDEKTITFDVAVISVNDQPSIDNAQFNIDENSPVGTVVGTINFADADAGDNLNLTITNGNADNVFSMNSDGDIILEDSLSLNYENETTTNSYSLIVEVKDDGTGTLSNTAVIGIDVIDVNDSPNDIIFAVTEIRDDTQFGGALGKVQAIDEDGNVFSGGDFHTFNLPAGMSDNNLFDFDNDNPDVIISAKNFTPNEVDNIYNVTIRAIDSLSASIDKEFTLIVVSSSLAANRAPIFVSIDIDTLIDHNLAGAGFAKLLTEDDPEDTHTYNMVAGLGDTHNEHFSINGDSLVANSQFKVTSDSLFSIRVRSTDSGTPALSLEEIVTFIVIPFVDREFPSINNVQVPTLFDFNTTVNITAEVTDNTELETVDIFYKNISQDDIQYLSQSATSNNGSTYSFELAPATHGAMGLEVYLSATDTSGNTFISTPSQKAYIQFNAGVYSVASQYLGSGGTKSDWRIFSIPYDLDQKDFKNIFGEAYGTYDKINWRLVRWKDDGTGNGSYIDFEDNSAKADLGQAYWFNALEPKEISLGAGKINSQDSTELILTSGFNQIGNPYNVPISWTKVLENNGKPSEVGTLQIFSENGEQKDGTILYPFSGGFVYVDGSAVKMYINPVSSKADVGGRIINNLPTSDLSNDSWVVEMNVSNNDVQQVVGSFGMHPNASVKKDQLDRLSVPRFQAFTEMYSKHEEYSYPWFRRDIVNSRNEYTWDFTYESNIIDGLASFIWNPDGFGDGFETLKLYNKENGELVDMRMQSSYQFEGGNSLKFAIFFSQDPNSIFVPDDLLLGNAYPNPTDGSTVFPIVLPDTRDHYKLEINIYNLQGKLVDTIVKGIYEAGIHLFQYNFNSNQTTKGIYIYQLRFNDGFHMPVQKKIFIKR